MKSAKKQIRCCILLIFTISHCNSILSQGFIGYSEPGTQSTKSVLAEQNRFKAQKIHVVEIYECLDSTCKFEEAQLAFTREYDPNGRLTREICFKCETDSMKTEFTYNQNNLLETITDFTSPEYPGKRILEYNSTGKLIREEYASGESRKYRFLYTPYGLVRQKIGQSYAADSTGKSSWNDCETTDFAYNKLGQIVEIKYMYVPGWGIPRIQKLFYNQKNQLYRITQSRIGNSDKEWVLEYSIELNYNTNGFIESESRISPEHGKSWLKYKYIQH